MKKTIDIYNFGIYTDGLTHKEIKQYLKLRSGKKRLGNLYTKFTKIAGVNTCVMNDIGEILMYRHDVERFADVLFGVTKTTYFD